MGQVSRPWLGLALLSLLFFAKCCASEKPTETSPKTPVETRKPLKKDELDSPMKVKPSKQSEKENKPLESKESEKTEDLGTFQIFKFKEGDAGANGAQEYAVCTSSGSCMTKRLVCPASCPANYGYGGGPGGYGGYGGGPGGNGGGPGGYGGYGGYPGGGGYGGGGGGGEGGGGGGGYGGYGACKYDCKNSCLASCYN